MASKTRILLVDDEASVLKVVKRRLETVGYDVSTAMDGQEGLQKAVTEKPDLIITDIMMPVMDGYTMVTKLRAEPTCARIPVIVLSAKDQMKDLFLFKGIKDCDYIVKPFISEELLTHIEKLLARVQTYLPPSS